MSIKPFRTIEEQIDILKSRGLIIADDQIEKTRDFLYKNNYYRISGYALTLRNHDIFYEDVNIQNVIDIYNFDGEFRNLLFKYLEKIEVRLKSIYAHELTKKYGAFGYKSISNFTDQLQALRIHGEIQKSNGKPKRGLSETLQRPGCRFTVLGCG